MLGRLSLIGRGQIGRGQTRQTDAQPTMAPVGKALVVIGLLITLLGLLAWAGGSMPLINRLGRLPGDIYIRRDNFTFYLPVTTCIVLSIVISLLIGLLRRW
jgi:hypothetical protein